MVNARSFKALRRCGGPSCNEIRQLATGSRLSPTRAPAACRSSRRSAGAGRRSEEHTSELQSRRDLVCRLLLEKKKKKIKNRRLKKKNKKKRIRKITIKQRNKIKTNKY